MSWRFKKSINICGCVRFNLCKRSFGVSAGVKGTRVGINSKGAYRLTSVPGTGIYNIKYLRASKGRAPQNKLTKITMVETSPVRRLPSKLSKNFAIGWIFYTLAIILIFVYWPIGLLALVGSISYSFLNKKGQHINRVL